MMPLKLIRKFVKIIRGSAGPLHIFLACLLGVMIGFVPGFNLTLVLGIALLVVLNVNLGIALPALALGKILSMVLAPLTFRIGFALIHHTPLEPVFAAMGDTPVLALLDLHYYCLLGGLLLALPVGAGLGLLAGAAVLRLRRAVLAASDRYSFVAKLNENRWYRFSLRVLFGKGNVADALSVRSPVLRTKGLVLAGVMLVVLVGLPMLLVDSMLAGRLAEDLARANGAEVNIRKVHLSVFGGHVSLEELQVTDPAHPERNIIQAEVLSGDVSIPDLLARRTVIDVLTIDDMRTDVPRERPGQVYPREERGQSPEIIFTDYFEKAREYEKYLDYLKRVREYMEKEPQERSAPRDVYDDARREARGYFALSAAELIPRHPRLLIRRLVVNRVPVGEAICRIDGENVSSEPRLNPEAMKLVLADILPETPDALGQRQRVALSFGGESEAGTIDLLLTDLPVPELSGAVPVDYENSRAVLRASGSFAQGQLNLPMGIALTGNGALRPGRTLFGLSPAASESLMKNAGRMPLQGVLSGPLDALRWQTDERATLAMLQESLTGAARAELAGQIRERMGKLDIGSGLDVGGILTGLSSGPEDDAKESKNEGGVREGLPGLLKNLAK